MEKGRRGEREKGRKGEEEKGRKGEEEKGRKGEGEKGRKGEGEKVGRSFVCWLILTIFVIVAAKTNENENLKIS
jgi:hypothetical protein